MTTGSLLIAIEQVAEETTDPMATQALRRAIERWKSTAQTVFVVRASYNEDVEQMIDSMYRDRGAAEAKVQLLNNAPGHRWPHWSVAEWEVS